MIFNNFLNTFRGIFYARFPMVEAHYTYKHKRRITSDIRTSCANKRKHYLVYRNSNDPTILVHFKKYCRILAKVIMTAKKSSVNKLLLKSNNEGV
jgi:ribosomal protein L33